MPCLSGPGAWDPSGADQALCPSPIATPAREQKAKVRKLQGWLGQFRTPTLSVVAVLEAPTGALRVSPLGVCQQLCGALVRRWCPVSSVPVSRVRHVPGAVHCLWTRCRPVESCCSCTHFPDELTEAGAERLGKAGSQSPS